MDYQEFIEQLPNLYENWGQETVRPKSNRFQQILNQMEGMTTANVMQLLNFAVECMEPDEIYCEIGTYQGTTLIGALLDRPSRSAYAVDNFSEFDRSGQTEQKLLENLAKFNLLEQVIFCNQDFQEFLLELREMETEEKIGVYFYDGAHDYRSQILGLLLARPFLADRALIVVDDSNWGTVKQANWDFISANPECELLLELSTPVPCYPTFWNGIQIFSWDASRKSNYSWSTFAQMRQESVIKAIYNVQLLEQRENALDTLYKEAFFLHQQEQFIAAEKKYKDFLLWKSDNGEAWLNLGILYYQIGDYLEAQKSILKSLEIDSTNAYAYYNIGLVLEGKNNFSEAIAAYRQAVTLAPDILEAYNNLGNLLAERGEISEAEAVYRQAIEVNSDGFGSYLNLGNLLLGNNQIEAAIEAYKTALNLNPDNSDILHNLEVALEAQKNPAPYIWESANKLFQRHRYEEAIVKYQQLIETNSNSAEVYYNLSDCFKSVNRETEAIQTLQEGIRLYPTAGQLHFTLITTLQSSGRTEEAIASAEEASRLLPNDYAFKILKNLILPILYDTPEEIDYYRQRYTTGMQNLIRETSLKTLEQRRDAMAGIGSLSNFYLVYQAQNDLELQRQYGNLVHQIMAANYPQWVEPLPMPPLKPGNKIRVGYVSAYLHYYSGTYWLIGWLRNCDREKFEIYCYYTGDRPDYLTQQFQEFSDVFHHIPDDFEGVCQQILSDELHILFFPEIGMEPHIIKMAGLRLAPLQCNAWGHPITSGIPTIDYYVSSELMEPEAAQQHYSERLILLPNLAIAYPKPDVPQLTKNRADFQIKEEAVVYLCCQAPFKYLPQHDYLFVEIARRVPQAQFIFFPRSNQYLKNKFQQRLKRAFATTGLNYEDYCVFLPLQARNDYLIINLLSDVYLDSLGFSGGNTTMDAIACNLPVVTCPGEFMRGRLSYAILIMLGVTETITQTEAEYIEIAVKLGTNSAWRQQIKEKIQDYQSNLFNDKVSVKALLEFYQNIVSEAGKQK